MAGSVEVDHGLAEGAACVGIDQGVRQQRVEDELADGLVAQHVAFARGGFEVELISALQPGVELLARAGVALVQVLVGPELASALIELGCQVARHEDVGILVEPQLLKTVACAFGMADQVVGPHVQLGGECLEASQGEGAFAQAPVTDRSAAAQALKKRVEAAGKEFTFEVYLGYSTVSLLADSLRDNSRGLTDVMLASADGRLWRIPSVTGDPYVSLGPKSFLSELGRPGGPSVVVGKPLQLRPGARYVLPMATRLSAPTGPFTATVGFIDLETLLKVYRARSMRPGTAVLLERDDGVAMARWPEEIGRAHV